MSVSYDVFADAFLNKITEYEFLSIADSERNEMIDGYMKRSVAAFRKICKYSLVDNMNDEERCFDIDIAAEDIDELADIISEGMLVQWMKPYVYKQENLENVLNTKDFTTYSPSELLLRIGDAYKVAKKDFTNMMREYSYNHGDLSDLHL